MLSKCNWTIIYPINGLWRYAYLDLMLEWIAGVKAICTMWIVMTEPKERCLLCAKIAVIRTSLPHQFCPDAASLASSWSRTRVQTPVVYIHPVICAWSPPHWHPFLHPQLFLHAVPLHHTTSSLICLNRFWALTGTKHYCYILLFLDELFIQYLKMIKCYHIFFPSYFYSAPKHIGFLRG